jgi:hypothetical protein
MRTPVLDLPKEAARVTRAMATNDSGVTREFVLVETRTDVSPVVRKISQDQTFGKNNISGLWLWERPDFSVARVGPNTIAVGSAPEVEKLVRVRLGIDADLKITGQLFDRFQALDRESAVRLISRDPPGLPRLFHPIFTRELLDSAQLLGLAITLQNPVKARLLLKLRSPESASQIARDLHNEPQRWLHLQDSDLPLFTEAPAIDKQGANLELRFNVPENSARLLLQRIAKTDSPTGVAGR